jgi:hypothetical protein
MRVLPWLVIVFLSPASGIANAQEETLDMPDPRTTAAIAVMMSFAEHTGLTSERPAQRYLWTDAFAVCNLLGLTRLTGEERYTTLALQLVDQVHRTLGRHRQDDPRTGWISGLVEREGEAHPTRGGLRIGKKLPERGPNEPFDERLERDRDGQYFHYLTRWMHALDQVTRSTQRPQFNQWARELAETAQHAFTDVPSADWRERRLYWKMSIDLTRPLVPSMSPHDPLDGYITFVQLRSTMARLPEPISGPLLDEEARQLAAMIEGKDWATADPLGLGGLLVDGFRVEQLARQGAAPDEGLLEALLTAALAGLQHYVQREELRLPAEYRLAFRELGLAIGLRALESLWLATDLDPGPSSMNPEVRARLEALMPYAPLADAIESFWRDPEHRATSTWSEHRDINDVMLATSLAPDGFLVLLTPTE